MPLTRDDVVSRALRLVDEDGLDALTLRSLASALGVQAPSLYTHVRSKADLLDALADRILNEVLTDDDERQGSLWQPWLLSLVARFRRILLAHRDGSRIVAGARGSLRRADFSELAIATLVDCDVNLGDARLLVLAVERFTVGYVLEEQSVPPTGDVAPPTPDQLIARLPTLTRAVVEYFQSGRTVDDLFEDEIRMIIRM